MFFRKTWMFIFLALYMAYSLSSESFELEDTTSIILIQNRSSKDPLAGSMWEKDFMEGKLLILFDNEGMVSFGSISATGEKNLQNIKLEYLISNNNILTMIDYTGQPPRYEFEITENGRILVLIGLNNKAAFFSGRWRRIN